METINSASKIPVSKSELFSDPAWGCVTAGANAPARNTGISAGAVQGPCLESLPEDGRVHVGSHEVASFTVPRLSCRHPQIEYQGLKSHTSHQCT